MLQIAPEYQEIDLPEHFRDLAYAYLDAAEQLCREMTEGSWPPTFHRGQVTLWLAFHATELFLKGCIWKASPSVVKNKHSLGELLLAFSAAFPGITFQAPFGPEPMPADWDLMEFALKADATLHQQLRYPVDTSGLPWKGLRAFSADLFRAELEQLRVEFLRVSSTVFGK